MPAIEAFLKNVYRDLRDRHLLLPVLAMLVALIAVPKLLAKDSEPTLSPPPPASAAAHASELNSAVLANGQVSVRDYRKRLKDLKKTNPFRQQFKAPAADSGSDTGTAGSAPESGGLPSAPGEVGTPPGATPPTDGSPPGTKSPGNDGNPSDNSGENSNRTHGGQANNPDGPDIKVVKHLYTRRVNLLVGIQGNPKVRENVKPMTTLPNDSNPVAAYLGTDEKGKRAAFVVSHDVTTIGGDGACVPSPQNCLYITLEKGETATLTFAGDSQTPGQTYELRLVAILKHRVPAE